MTESILEFVQKGLTDAGRHEWPSIHVATGVPLSTIEKLAYGIDRNYTMKSVEPLFKYFNERQAA